MPVLIQICLLGGEVFKYNVKKNKSSSSTWDILKFCSKKKKHERKEK